MKIFAKKDWEILQETTTESQAEQLMRLTDQCPAPRNRWDMEEMTRKKHITILKCKNTGKIKRFVEKI